MPTPGPLPIPAEVLNDASLDDAARAEQATLVQAKYDELAAKLQLSKPEEWQLVEKALVYAWGKHNKQKRDDGRPYIIHPLEVAIILTDYYANDANVMAAALLHDVAEDCGVTIQTIDQEFNPTIAFWVDGLTKINEIAREGFSKGDTKQSINYRKLLLAIEEDVRIIIIKLADRLHNMRTLDVRKSTKQRATASQTLYFYVPIAEYLGVYNVKGELEDLSFRYLEPARYAEIRNLLEGAAQQHEQSLRDFAAPIEAKLKENGILCEVTHRTKSIHSISQKLSRKNVQFEDVYDLLAMRIVFEPIPDIPERTQCWYIYMLITDRQTVMHERTRDWVTSPKVNGYEALHCTMLSKEGYWVEVQIRTSRMHRVAEFGITAHHLYKGQGFAPANLASMRQIIREEQGEPSVNFVDNFRRKIRTPELQVYTADKTPYEIEQNYTALDFAFVLSNKVGMHAIAARINGELCSLDRKLRGGDVVEIITANSQRPTERMANIVNSAQARSAISKAIVYQADHEVENGRRVVRKLLNERGLDEGNPWILDRLCRSLGVRLNATRLTTNQEDILKSLYLSIANGYINPDILRRRVRFYSRYAFLYRKGERPSKARQNGENGALQYVQLSCCHAIPGDDVIGHLTASNKVFVHRTSCPEAMRLEAQGLHSKLVTVDWEPHPDKAYLVHVYISGYDRPRLLSTLFARLSDEMRINILRVAMRSEGEIFRGVVGIEVPSTAVIQMVIRAARAIPGIRKVYRVDREQVSMGDGSFYPERE